MELRKTIDLKIKKIMESDAYELWTIYHPELGFPTYGIVNKEHDIIEHLQPNLHNAINVLEEFNIWLKTGKKSVTSLEELLNDGQTPN